METGKELQTWEDWREMVHDLLPKGSKIYCILKHESRSCEVFEVLPFITQEGVNGIYQLTYALRMAGYGYKLSNKYNAIRMYRTWKTAHPISDFIRELGNDIHGDEDSFKAVAL